MAKEIDLPVQRMHTHDTHKKSAFFTVSFPNGSSTNKSETNKTAIGGMTSRLVGQTNQ
jgi:hypothetical protein